MTEIFNGYVLYGSRNSPANATSTSPAEVGISRDIHPLSPDYTISAQPLLVDARGDQYRTAIIYTPPAGDEEYLVWSANGSSLALVEDSSWAITDGTGSIPVGTLSVTGTPNRTDGSPYVVILDNGNRTIAGLVSITVQRGGSPTQYTLTISAGDISCSDPSSGLVTLNPTANTLAATLPVDPTKPALSQARGDQVVGVSYWIASSRFWWTRNDTYQTRFGWNGGTQRWEPYRGGPVKNLGYLLTGTTVVLSPRPRRNIGEYLPGGTTPDSYAMLRVGQDPGIGSLPLGDDPLGTYRGVLVLSDDDAPLYIFSGSPAPAAVVGQTNGKVYWNPAFVQDYAGQSIWYSPQDYESSSDGVVGYLKDAGTTPIYLAPVPGPTDRPIIRLGNRRPLLARVFETEANLGSYTPGPGEVGVALTTGRIKLNTSDISKADPGTSTTPNPNFDLLFLGTVVRYDGVTLNQYPQPIRAATILVDSSGNPVTSYAAGTTCYVPDGRDTPALGKSGMAQVPDKTGTIPDPSFPVTPRPGSSGLVRSLPIGESIIFTRLGAIEKTTTVNFNDEFPTNYNLPVAGEVIIALEKSTYGSQVRFSSADQSGILSGQTVYFLQTDFCPSVYMPVARMFSKVRDTFTFTGNEVFQFSIDGVDYSWNSATLIPSPGPGVTYTATQVAASIQSILGSSHTCRELAGRVVLETKLLNTGSINIGFGYGGVRDISGCISLGFLPGWIVKSPATGDKSGSDLNWLPDSGLSFTMFRSALNLDRTGTVPDYQATQRMQDQIISSSVAPTTYQFLTDPPLEDIPGYGPGVFFELTAPSKPGQVLGKRSLESMKDVQYLFQGRKFAWLGGTTFSEQIQVQTISLSLGQVGIVPESLYTAVGGYLKVAPDGGNYQTLDLGIDFIFQPGDTSSVYLITKYGEKVLFGAQGVFVATSNTFTDATQNFLAAGILVGYRLKITSVQGAGYYEVTAVGTTTLTVSPAFRIGNGSSKATWEIYRGWTTSAIDPTLMADVVSTPFSHLSSEPFIVRTLNLLGTLPATLKSPDIAKGLLSGRSFYVRFDRTGTDIPVTVLGTTVLGVITNSTLYIPITSHFAFQAFSIRVGTREFTHATNLVPVTVFSSDPGGGNGIEYLTTTGQMKFGSNLLTVLASSDVVYVDRPRASVNIPSGQSDLDPATAILSLSSADLVMHPTSKVYFVEKMIKDSDVVLSPLNGSFTFRNPLAAGQLVEAEYYRAVQDTGAQYKDSSGNPVLIKEFLPVYIRREVATRITSQRFSFNSAGRTLDTSVSPAVYSGGGILTYGMPPEATVNFSIEEISVVTPIPVGTDVLISYAVLEALGGEITYTVSTPPVWRPPFQLAVGSNTFTLSGNRTDMVPGKLLKVGPSCFYVKVRSYNPTLDQTTVTIFPTPTVAAGSASPANDVGSVLSDRPVTSSVDGVPIPTAPVGFLPSMALAYGMVSDPIYDPVLKGDLNIRFRGDVRQYLRKDHLLEIGGYPFYLSTDATLSQDGQFTQVGLIPPAPKAFIYGTDVAKVSTRPIYLTGERNILGFGPIAPDQPFELVLWGETDSLGVLPGRVLVPNVEYTLDLSSGSVALKSPKQAGFGPNQRLTLSHTRTESLGPFMYQGTLNYPRYTSKALYVEAPSVDNGIQGAILKGTYTFDAPDSFYTRTELLTDFLDDFNQKVSQKATESNPSSGTVPPTPAKNSDYGREGSGSQKLDLLNQDRAVRCYLSWYNETISAFEQIEETIDGRIIGDRSGKFRFQVGRQSMWSQPGYEDDLMGILNPRNVWADTFSSARGTPLRITTDDDIVDPVTATTDANGRVIGPAVDPSRFQQYLAVQESLITNDVDDVVLVAKKDVTRELVSVIAFRIRAKGDFRRTGSPNQFSRIFPERTSVFTTLNPGVFANETTNDPGVYTFGRLSGTDIYSTFQKPIGKLTNPVLGTVLNAIGLTAQERRARARIWGFSATGYPTLDPATTGKPTIIATPLSLIDFPISQATGLPDLTKLVSSGSVTGLYDLSSGDLDLHTPPFKSGDQLALGFSSGNYFELGCSNVLFSVNGTLRYSGVFVDAVLQGCLITLKDCAGTSITAASSILAGTQTTSPTVTPEKGNTVFVIPTGGLSSVISGPWSYSSFIQSVVRNVPGYRTGFDFNFSPRTGDIVDVTMPSLSDPTVFGVKELLGQNPPKPGSTFEGIVDFSNGSTRPTQIPALFGGRANDSGDYSIPYLMPPSTELDRLSALADAITYISFLDSPTPPPIGYSVEAVYPDEIFGEDGAVSSTGLLPGRMTTSEDLQPKTTSGLYPAPGHAGIGDLASYDLMLVEPGTGTPGLPNGSYGILSVGAVYNGTPSTIEPPRFVCPGSTKLKYTFTNAMGWVDSPAHTRGIIVFEDTVSIPGRIVTTFDISSLSNLTFDDDAGGGWLWPPIGGLNDFFAQAEKDAAIRIKLYTWIGGLRVPGAEVILKKTGGGGDILSCAFDVSGDGGATFIPVLPSGAYFRPNYLVILTAAGGSFFNFTSFDPIIIAPGVTRTDGFHDFNLDVIAWNGGSYTSQIMDDRLTFTEVYDFRTIKPRGTLHPLSGLSLAGELSINYMMTKLYDVDAGADVDVRILVNSDTIINNSQPFTFLDNPHTPSRPWGVGTFNAARGSARVPSFEGMGNVPIQATDIKFSAMPSSRQDDTGPILAGTALAGEIFDVLKPQVDRDNRLVQISPTNGDISRVLPGDTVCIYPISSARPNTKVGTSLVRVAQVPTPGRVYKELTSSVSMGTGEQWVPLLFPKVTSVSGTDLYTDITQTIVPTRDSSGLLYPTRFTFNSTGRVFVIANLGAIESTDPNVYKTAVYSADYTSYVAGHFGGLSNYRDGLGQVVTQAVFNAAAVAGKMVSGMTALPVQFTDKGVPGYCLPGTTVYGFTDIQYTRVTTVGLRKVQYTVAAGEITGTIGVGTHLGVFEGIPFDPTTFSTYDVAYWGTPTVMFLVDVNFDHLHDTNSLIPGGAVGATRCLLPGDNFVTATVGGTPGFLLEAGVFMEPSFPTPVNDLNSPSVNVVDAIYVLPNVGMRDLGTYTVAAIPANHSLQERVAFEVKRPRRFHQVTMDFIGAVEGLRYVYEIRRGIVNTYTPMGTYGIMVASRVNKDPMPSPDPTGYGTQLGDFTDSDVNINAGDIFRLLDASGTVISEAPIASVPDGITLNLAPPGITVSVPSGLRFEVWLKKPIVPQEQSSEQLLELATDSTLVTRVADPSIPRGGTVLTVNTLTDSGEDFSQAGVQQGDILLVDPAGDLLGPTGPALHPERGCRPFGDDGVVVRPTSYTAGSPDKLDDNRGYYTVDVVTQHNLQVTASGELAGNITTGDKILGTSTLTSYVVYPTVHASGLVPGGREGQMDLRVTGFAGEATSDPNSYLGTYKSIGPFSYRVIRPISFLSKRAMELILSTRERILSWMEELIVLYNKGSTYYIFQRDQHISNLGSSYVYGSGLGLPSEPILRGIRGRVEVSPFVSSDDCVSILDRRFWCLDMRLDSLIPPFTPPWTPTYTSFATGVGRPVLPDRIEDVLDQKDHLRQSRYAWLMLRVDRVSGTLTRIDNFDQQMKETASDQSFLLRITRDNQ